MTNIMNMEETMSMGKGTSADEIRYDAKSFIIGGQRVFLNSAAIHYFRMPRQEWREVLVKAKLAGMNCIDTYFAWNVHETQEGTWDFEGDKDCGAFLDLCAELGLWVIARPGPFICAEWDFGGFPWWLKTKEDIQFRTDNETYLNYVNLYLDRILPIIRSRQLTKGGTVILVQVENEYGYLAEDESGKVYMNGLRDGFLERGIDVPLITCEGGAEGTIEGANFWSGADGHYSKLMNKQPDVPKIVTEFWTGWFEHWGAPSATQKTAELYERKMLEAIRAGFDGISHYMFFGGTNFGGYGGRTVGSSDIFMVTSYDYDAPLSEYGRITPKYKTAKRVSLFTQAMSEFLLESESSDSHAARSREGVTLRCRQWGTQKLWFAESSKKEKEVFPITFENGRTLLVSIKPGQIVPILDRIEVCPGIRLTCGAMLIGNDRIGDVQTIILSGDDGQRTLIVLEADQEITFDNAAHIRHEWGAEKRSLQLDLFHFETPQRIRLLVGSQSVEIIVLNDYMSDRAWRLEGNEARWAIGYEDLDISSDGSIKAVAAANGAESILLGAEALQRSAQNSGALSRNRSRTALSHSRLSEWQRHSVRWDSLLTGKSSERPRGFATLEREFGYLTYNSEIDCEQDGKSVLVFSAIQDSARVFVNGKEQALISQVGAASASLSLPKGRSQLQVLVQHMGSLNFSPYLGEEKGIFGPVYCGGSVIDLRRNWTCGNATVHLDEAYVEQFSTILKQTFEWTGHDGAILVGALSNGLHVNGKEVPLDGYQNWFANYAVDLSEYLVQGTNLIEMPVAHSPLNRLELISYSRSQEIKGWTISTLESIGPLEIEKTSDAGPIWLRSEFDLPFIPEDANAKLKLRLTGMSKGFLLLNGRDLGRYWQIGPQEDYKIPLAWLKETGNELILFDEEGRQPDSVRLFFDAQSNNSWEKLEIR